MRPTAWPTASLSSAASCWLGTYGTGKTMAATVASRLAVDAGITYVYVPRADELSDAIEFAKQYQSPACVIFCAEDIE